MYAIRSYYANQIRGWVAGCATGEEAYSVAIALSLADAGRPMSRVTVLGTDLNARAVEQAREA